MNKEWSEQHRQNSRVFMRPIETAPKDGQVIILEDGAMGTYEVAHWSPFGEWVGENGEPSKITPTHWYPMPPWYPMPRDESVLQEHDESVLQEHKESSNPSQVGRARRRLAAIAATLIAAAFIGLNFRSEVAAYVTRYAGQQDIVGIIKIGRQVVAQETRLPSKDMGKTALPASRQTEANQAGAPEEAQQAQQVALAAVPEAQQSLTEEPAQALAQELTEARRAEFEQLRAEAAKSVQSLEQERDKTAAVAQEAAAVRRDLTGSIVHHRQALEEERARGAALASELAQARREVETQIALLRKAGDEAVDVKQKPAAVEERPGVSLPAHSDAFVKPAQPAKQLDVTPENSKPAIKPVETVPLPRQRAMSPDNGYSCQRYRTYDPASETYKGYDGQRHSCRPPESGRKSGNALQRQQASSQQVNPDITGRTNVAPPEDPEASSTLRQVDEQAEAVETHEKPTKLFGWFGR